MIDNKRSPVGYIIIADFLFPLCAFHDREYEMYVGMHQFIEFHAGRTCSAGISLPPISATDVTCVCNSQRHFPDPFRSANKLGMWNTPLIHFLNEPLLDFFLSDYVSENISINDFGYFFDTVYCSDRVEMNTWYSMSHQLLALGYTPFDTYLLGFHVILAFQSLFH